MTYLDTLEEKARTVIKAGDEKATLEFVKQTALESFKNGLEAKRMSEVLILPLLEAMNSGWSAESPRKNGN